jgi:hypothetical protein
MQAAALEARRAAWQAVVQEVKASAVIQRMQAAALEARFVFCMEKLVDWFHNYNPERFSYRCGAHARFGVVATAFITYKDRIKQIKRSARAFARGTEQISEEEHSTSGTEQISEEEHSTSGTEQISEEEQSTSGTEQISEEEQSTSGTEDDQNKTADSRIKTGIRSRKRLIRHRRR